MQGKQGATGALYDEYGQPLFNPMAYVQQQYMMASQQQLVEQPYQTQVAQAQETIAKPAAKPKQTAEEKHQIDLWLEQRRKNFPGKVKPQAKEAKKTIDNQAEEFSSLEKKLRQRLSILLSQMGGGGKNKQKNCRQQHQQDRADKRQKRFDQQPRSDQAGNTAACTSADPKAPQAPVTEPKETNNETNAPPATQDADAKGQEEQKTTLCERRDTKMTAKQRKKQRKLEQQAQKVDQEHNEAVACKDPAEQVLQTFKYRKNMILSKLLQSEREKEASVILQAFRFLIAKDAV